MSERDAATWYYSVREGQREGPVERAALQALDAAGQLPPQALVWTAGMAQWQPWANQRGETLGIADAATGAIAPPPARALVPATAAEVVDAGFWKRVAASMIDGFVVGMAAYALQLPMFVFLGVGFDGQNIDEDMLASSAWWLTLALIYASGFLVQALYFSWMHASSHQATLGKLAIGIKVVRSDGSRLTFWRAFGRYWGYVLGALALCIGLLMAAFTRRKQALHDLLSDTVVVDKWAFTDSPQLQRRALGAVAISVLAVVGVLWAMGLLVLLALAAAGYALLG